MKHVQVFKRHSRWLVVALTLLIHPLSFSTSVANAHELPGSTATVVVRDGLITIDANLDVEAWMRAHSSVKLETMVAAARKEANALTVLVDGKKMEMELEVFPSVEQVHAVLQRKTEGGHAHPKIVEARWQAKRAKPALKSVVASFPPSAGEVRITFLEPRSQLVTPGGKAPFERLHFSSVPAPQSTSQDHSH